jgi:CBS domain-containing protein
MDEPVTVRDVMNRSYVGVSEADSVAGAAELMRDEGVHSAVVLRGSEPVGVLDEDRLIDVVADRRDPAETTAGDVMRPAVAVDADQRLEGAIGAMTTDGLRHLLVEENGEVVASVSEHDIVTAYSVLGARTEPAEAPMATPTAVGDEAAAELDREVYSTQGVCESCGALTRELSSHNGQLVCADCLGL